MKSCFFLKKQNLIAFLIIFQVFALQASEVSDQVQKGWWSSIKNAAWYVLNMKQQHQASVLFKINHSDIVSSYVALLPRISGNTYVAGNLVNVVVNEARVHSKDLVKDWHDYFNDLKLLSKQGLHYSDLSRFGQEVVQKYNVLKQTQIKIKPNTGKVQLEVAPDGVTQFYIHECENQKTIFIPAFLSLAFGLYKQTSPVNLTKIQGYKPSKDFKKLEVKKFYQTFRSELMFLSEVYAFCTTALSEFTYNGNLLSQEEVNDCFVRAIIEAMQESFNNKNIIVYDKEVLLNKKEITARAFSNCALEIYKTELSKELEKRACINGENNEKHKVFVQTFQKLKEYGQSLQKIQHEEAALRGVIAQEGLTLDDIANQQKLDLKKIFDKLTAAQNKQMQKINQEYFKKVLLQKQRQAALTAELEARSIIETEESDKNTKLMQLQTRKNDAVLVYLRNLISRVKMNQVSWEEQKTKNRFKQLFARRIVNNRATEYYHQFLMMVWKNNQEFDAASLEAQEEFLRKGLEIQERKTPVTIIRHDPYGWPKELSKGMSTI